MIESTRLLIRKLQESDIAEIYEMNSYPEVARYNTIGIPASVDDTRKLLEPIIRDQQSENPKTYGWTIRDKQNLKFRGEIGLRLSAPRFRMGEVHYSLHPDFWGNGYATEGLRGILDYTFSVLKLHRIEAGVDSENSASIRVLERLGMVREGLRRKILPIRGEWRDSYLYSILDKEWNM